MGGGGKLQKRIKWGKRGRGVESAVKVVFGMNYDVASGRFCS